MSKETFEYTYLLEGKKIQANLPFDPTLVRFKVKERKNCCLYFYHDVKNDLQLRVKTREKTIFLNQILERDEYTNEIERTKTLMGNYRPTSHRSFLEKIGAWL